MGQSTKVLVQHWPGSSPDDPPFWKSSRRRPWGRGWRMGAQSKLAHAYYVFSRQPHFQTSSSGHKNGVSLESDGHITKCWFWMISYVWHLSHLYICPLSLHFWGNQWTVWTQKYSFQCLLLHHCWADEWTLSFYQVRLNCLKFDLQTPYALDVAINKSGASRQFKGCENNYTGHSRAY